MNDVKRFDVFIKNNYERLRLFCYNYLIDEEKIHIAYDKVKEKIKRDGFQGKAFYSYMIRTMINQTINDKYTPQYKKIVYLSECRGEVEQKLRNNDKEVSLENERFYRSMYINEMMLRFIKAHYDEVDTMLFKLYFFTSNMTYKKLDKIVKISRNHLVNKIREMKERLNSKEFIKFVEDEERRNQRVAGKTKKHYAVE